MATPIGSVTDQDVLAAYAADDQLASNVDQAFASAGDAVPAGVLAQWQTTLSQYTTEATAAKASASGGFFGGAWFGVADMYQSALNWQKRLQGFAAQAQQYKGGAVVAAPSLPDPAGGNTPGKLTLKSVPWWVWAGGAGALALMTLPEILPLLIVGAARRRRYY